MLPGLPSGSAVPSYAGMALGSGHTEADVRGEVDWAALAAAPGPLVLHADVRAPGRDGERAGRTRPRPADPGRDHRPRPTRQQRTVEATLATLNDAGSEWWVR